jgi:hypothetical protein
LADPHHENKIHFHGLAAFSRKIRRRLQKMQRATALEFNRFPL